MKLIRKIARYKGRTSPPTALNSVCPSLFLSSSVSRVGNEFLSLEIKCSLFTWVDSYESACIFTFCFIVKSWQIHIVCLLGQ